MNRISNHQQQFISEWRRLAGIWRDACTKWRDKVRLDFERQCWDELEKETLEYVKALEALCDGASDLR